MGTLAEFPGVNQVRIGGRSFRVNTSFEPYRRDAFRHRTIPAQRESINVAGKTGEGTVNSEGLWRWSALDWSYGAGQLYADREGTVPNRFYQSKGISPWVQFQVSLLQDTVQKYSDSYSATSAVSIGPVVFIKGQYTIKYTTDWVTFTTLSTITQSGADIFTFITHDNANVYVCSPTKGVWAIPVNDTTVGTPVHIITDDVDWVGAAGGRLFCSQNNSLYDISSPLASGHLPTPLMTHSEPNWVWQTAVAGSSAIYFSGNAQESSVSVSNTFSAVYRSTIEADGTAMQAPVVAITMPNNEFVNIMFQYLNYVFLGTSQGVRMCRTVSANDPSGNTGDLISGPIIPNYLGPATPTWVTGFCANGRYIYFTWQQGLPSAGGYAGTGYDGVSNGLGRLDVGTLVDELAPAYASDLMITGTDYIFWLDWDPITNGPMISLSTSGIWTQDTANLVASGSVDSPRITWNIPDEKIVAQGLIRRDSSGLGTVTMSIETDGSGFTAATPLSPNAESNPPVVFTSGPYAPTDGVSGMFRGEEVTVRTILNRDSSSHNSGPQLFRSTIKSFPAVVSGTTISAVLLEYKATEGQGWGRPVISYDDYLYLENLRLSQTPVLYQEGTANGNQNTPATGYTAIVLITELDWLPYKERDDGLFGYEGDLICYVKTIVG